VPLPAQDRSRWDGEGIAAGIRLLESVLRAGVPGPYQIEAAISAVHCRARSAEATDWEEIATLYELLERASPSPAVRANRAFAVARARGAAAGLALLDEVAVDAPGAALVRGALLEELGQREAAAVALQSALERARNAEEATQIRERIDRLRSS
jgi:RNA polymerase sigma-70 factor (ECF subfamily)